MYKPAHPGEVLKEMYLEPLGLTVTNDAVSLGITRMTLSELINGRSGISTSVLCDYFPSLISRSTVNLINPVFLLILPHTCGS
jgi:hypothetical protein